MICVITVVLDENGTVSFVKTLWTAHSSGSSSGAHSKTGVMDKIHEYFNSLTLCRRLELGEKLPHRSQDGDLCLTDLRQLLFLLLEF